MTTFVVDLQVELQNGTVVPAIVTLTRREVAEECHKALEEHIGKNLGFPVGSASAYQDSWRIGDFWIPSLNRREVVRRAISIGGIREDVLDRPVHRIGYSC